MPDKYYIEVVMKNFKRNSLLVIGFLILTLAYSNCGQVSFEKTEQASQASSSNDSQGADIEPDANGNLPIPDSGVVTNPGDSQQNIIADCNKNTQTLFKEFVIENPINPNTSSCPFGQADNLGRRNEYFQARIEQSKKFELPKDAVLCNVQFAFPEQAFNYDDHFVFSLNNNVLASSYKFSSLVSQNNLLKYDWANIRGKKWDSSVDGIYCADGDSSKASLCSFPKTEQQGSIKLEFAPQVFQKIFMNHASSGLDTNMHEFKWVTIGDNDDFDCEHTSIRFSVLVTYVGGASSK